MNKRHVIRILLSISTLLLSGPALAVTLTAGELTVPAAGTPRVEPCPECV